MTNINELDYFLEDIDNPKKTSQVIKVVSKTGDEEYLLLPELLTTKLSGDKLNEYAIKFTDKANKIYPAVSFTLMDVLEFPKSLQDISPSTIDELAQQQERRTGESIIKVTENKKETVREVPEGMYDEKELNNLITKANELFKDKTFEAFKVFKFPDAWLSRIIKKK
jgi:hypothetical protein